MDSPKQNAWNFASLFVYFIFLVTVAALIENRGIDITKTSGRDLLFIILATYRLTRIVVFEKIFKFFRDFVKTGHRFFFLTTLRFIITCPWCMGVWMSLIVVLLFFLIPYGKFIVYIMAVSGVASFMIMMANYLVLSIHEQQYRKNSYENSSDESSRREQGPLDN